MKIYYIIFFFDEVYASGIHTRTTLPERYPMVSTDSYNFPLEGWLVAGSHTNGFTWLYIKAESKKQGINTLNFIVQIL